MARVTELRTRGDWQFVRFVYLPIAGLGLTPFNVCALCTFCYWWAHHVEEWAGRKPLFRITEAGLRYEEGGRPFEYQWSEISGIVLHRRNTIPFWRTDGDVRMGKPPYWLAITVRPAGAGEDRFRTICIWPRQVVGGLFSLMRFAKELQRRLLERADRGEIPLLMKIPRQAPSHNAAARL